LEKKQVGGKILALKKGEKGKGKKSREFRPQATAIKKVSEINRLLAKR